MIKHYSYEYREKHGIVNKYIKNHIIGKVIFFIILFSIYIALFIIPYIFFGHIKFALPFVGIPLTLPVVADIYGIMFCNQKGGFDNGRGTRLM